MTKNPSQHEKRSERRAITDVAMEVYDMEGRELVGVARLMNLSTTGALVETTSALGGRKSLFVRMLLNGRLVATPVELMWERAGDKTREYGLKFGPLSEEMQEAVRAFAAENLAFYEESDLSLSPPPGAVVKP